MEKLVSRRLDMAVRARDFCDTNPSTDLSFVSVLGRLEDAINRMVEQGSRQVSGFLSRHASAVTRREIRRRLRNDLLPHLVTVARDASAEKPGLGDKFEIPSDNSSSTRFYAAAKAMLETAVAEKDLLLKRGLAASLLEDVAAALTEFEASVTAGNAGRESHIAARAELRAGSDELVRLVSMMDGINRYRFRTEPHLLVAWEAAKHVVTGPETKAEAPNTPAAAQPGTAGPTGEVKPAA